jgi:hypothetical protein
LHHQPRRLLLLACTATKRADPHPIPAIERYDGPSFRTLRKWRAANAAAAEHLDVLILSARLGLIAADALISDYNQRMTRARAAELHEAVDAALTHTLAQRGPYTATLVHLSRDYLPAIGQSILQTPAYGLVSFTNGGIGVRLSQIKTWLTTNANTMTDCEHARRP